MVSPGASCLPDGETYMKLNATERKRDIPSRTCCEEQQFTGQPYLVESRHRQLTYFKEDVLARALVELCVEHHSTCTPYTCQQVSCSCTISRDGAVLLSHWLTCLSACPHTSCCHVMRITFYEHMDDACYDQPRHCQSVSYAEVWNPSCIQAGPITSPLHYHHRH